jgi:hypothetical protein
MPKSTSRRKKSPKRVLALPRPGTSQDGRAEQPDVCQRSATYEHAIREFVA